MYTVYILYSKAIDRYYIGYSNNLERRIKEHNREKGKYTDRGIPWEIVYAKSFESKELAKQMEAYIKKRKSRLFIQNLINNKTQ